MDNNITLDNEIINTERSKLKLPSPSTFPNFEITTGIFNQLIPLVSLQFDDSVVVKKTLNGYKQQGVSIHLQNNRINNIFGLEHINWIYSSQELDASTTKSNKVLYSCKVDCILQIGNRKSYTNVEGIPGSAFIPVYECSGLGYSENINRGSAEKNAIINAKKECLKNLGILNYLYVEELDDTEDEYIDENKSNTNMNFSKTKLQLLSKPTINLNAVIVLKASALDTKSNETIEIIAYKDDYENLKHAELLDKLKTIELNTRDIINVSYVVNQAHTRKQYVIKEII